jgi:small conductance mechanosensitive channel
MRRIDMVFGIGYDDNISHAEEVLKDILKSDKDILRYPEPVIRIGNLGDSSVDFLVRPWVKTKDYWEVRWRITRAVKERFDAEDISIPFPQRDIHIVDKPAIT